MNRRLVLAALVVLPALTAFSQGPTRPKQVTDLGWMVGTWTGAGKFSLGGQTVDTKLSIVVTFDGQFLKEVSTADMGAFKSTETMMLGWDAAKNQYSSYTFADYAATPGIKHGTMTGESLTLVSEPWAMEGMTVLSRSTMTKVSDSKFKSKMEIKNGEKWDTAMDIELAKS